MLYKLIKKSNGKEEVDSIDTLSVINRRKKTLGGSLRGKKVELFVVLAEESEKFRKPCNSRHY